ncbi:MAG: T9SS type A sorting domain-containing protein [Bacteroidia bacterium]|nr:T9SS type A sorting domain-containing protein [Bacteroidia bacterium]MBP7727809.1 T9SS type A sorting domain-containing protein [Bacteroidia bacterium]MBP7771849.1 T9SS type A sorting domain-containing protein [Bacteroidia bacterium]
MKIYISFILILCSFLSYAQDYATIRANFLQNYDNITDENEGSPLNQFLRLDNYQRLRLSYANSLQEIETSYKDYLINNNLHRTQGVQAVANWESIGPNKRPISVSPVLNYASGNGLFTTIRLDPVDLDRIIITSAHGGVWETTNSGGSWINLSDFSLPSVQVSDIARDPTDPNFMYVAMGNRDDYHQLTLCSGIYRSNDGGVSWNAANNGLNSLIGFESISKILIDPQDPNIVYLATSNGIFKTIDAKGACSWIQLSDPLVYNNYFRNVLYIPNGQNNVLLASGVDVVKSHDGGQTWISLTGVGTGMDFSTFVATPFVSRINIAVTPINPDVIYASVILKDTPGLPQWNTTRRHYLFKYNGSTWSQRNNIPPNYNYNGDHTESWIAIDVSPVNENMIAVGHSSGFFSFDGGSTNLTPAYVYFGGIVHPDVHDIQFSRDGSSVYFATDGGVYKYLFSTSTWSMISNGIAANTVTKIALSDIDPNLMLMGAFHSGSNKYDPINLPPTDPWVIYNGGDGTEQGVVKNLPHMLFASSQKNTISLSMNRAISQAAPISRPLDPGCSNGPENSRFVGNYKLDPSESTTVVVAYTDLYSYNSINSVWKKLTDLPSDFGFNDCNQGVNAVSISESDHNYIYISGENANRLFKTNTGGYGNQCTSNCWTELFPPNPLPITSIAISYTDPNKIWVAYSGYISTEKVKYFDGFSWIDYSSGLPNLPMNEIVYEKGSNDALYVATDIGVYYRNATMLQWEPFIDNLPNVMVSDLEINYANNTIVAGTFGRGVWQSDLNCPQSFDLTAQPGVNFYEAENNLLAFSSFTLSPTLTFRAGNTVKLDPGFEVASSSAGYFQAFIHPCNHPGNSFKKRFNQVSGGLKSISEPEFSISVYPNPTQSLINIEVNTDSDEDSYVIEIYNVTGNKLAQKNENKFPCLIDMTKFGQGIYFVRIFCKQLNRYECKRVVVI